MDYFNELANELLQIIPDDENDLETNREIIVHDFNDGCCFKLIYRGYKGKMANPKKLQQGEDVERYKKSLNRRKKMGYFDFVVDTGNFFNTSKVTHQELFEVLQATSNLKNCGLIWRGHNPIDIGENTKEQKALLTLSLFMFEQEVNWGDEIFQKYTHFQVSKNYRPRDMIMGMLYQMFELGGVDQIKYLNEERGVFDFGPEGFAGYPEEEKARYFENLRDIAARQDANTKKAVPLMTNGMLERFKKKVENEQDNPKIKAILRELDSENRSK